MKKALILSCIAALIAAVVIGAAAVFRKNSDRKRFTSYEKRP